MNLSIPYQLVSEQECILACIRQEHWAQKKLYEDHYSQMMAVALRYAGNHEEALDILHESFVKIFRNLTNFQPGTSVSAWIRKIVINTSIDFYRREKKRKTEALEEALHIKSSIPDAISTLSSDEILIAIQQLPPSYRSVFNLYVIEGYAHKEIAEMLGINESTCRANLVKARNKLQHILLKQENDPHGHTGI